ncbi:MAG: DUF4384 domain-containing protein [Pseudomonadota bacterium]
MKTQTPRAPRRLPAALALVGALGMAGSAQAENHALIMTIDYAGTNSALVGIDLDAKMAHQIALGLGVPAANIRDLRNGALKLAGMTGAIEEFTNNRVKEGDKVFLYYSGHGMQINNTGGGTKCTEAMVSADLRPYSDAKLEGALDALAVKASQVVMMNDSCFSGGQSSSKSADLNDNGAIAKFYDAAKAGSASDAGYVCSDAVNKSPLTRTLGVIKSRPASRILYIAASADNEVSWAQPGGSTGTIAWTRCLSGGAGADRDANGMIDGDELRVCAQALLDKNNKRQTMTLRGATGLPLSFTASSSGGGSAVTNPSQSLETLRQAADVSIPVELSISNPRLKINSGVPLDFSVRTDRAGYVYLLHVDTAGKFYQLFPHAGDKDNYLAAGTHRFPRGSSGIGAMGPAGKGYLMAYVSTQPRNFGKDMATEGGYATAASTDGNVQKLAIIALGGRYGASRVATIEEFN